MNIRIKQLLLNVAKATLDYKVSWYKQDSGYTVGLSDGRSINLVLYKDEYLDEPWKITFRFFLEGSSRSFDYFFFEEPFMQLFCCTGRLNKTRGLLKRLIFLSYKISHWRE